MNKRSVDEGIARYTSSTQLRHDYVEKGGAGVWIAIRRAQLDVLLWWIVSLPNFDIKQDKMFLMPHSRVEFCCQERIARFSGHNDIEIVSSESCLGSVAISTAEKKAFFRCPGSQFILFYNAAGNRVLAMTFKIERVEIPAFSVFVDHGHLKHAGPG